MGTGGAVVSSCGARAGRGEALCACGRADASKAHEQSTNHRVAFIELAHIHACGLGYRIEGSANRARGPLASVRPAPNPKRGTGHRPRRRNRARPWRVPFILLSTPTLAVCARARVGRTDDDDGREEAGAPHRPAGGARAHRSRDGRRRQRRKPATNTRDPVGQRAQPHARRRRAVRHVDAPAGDRSSTSRRPAMARRASL